MSSALTAFLRDETTGSGHCSRWAIILVLVANEARGLFVAAEGARLMGWW